MKILLIHQNFPGQFKHIAAHFAAQPGNQVVAICQDYAPALNDPTYKRVTHRVYKPHRGPTQGIHHYVRCFESAVLNGQAVAKIAHALGRQGFVPDVILGHSGWGELLYLKDVFPDTPLLAYSEFYYHAKGVDADFDPEFPIDQDDHLRIRSRNVVPLLTLTDCDLAITPTTWQQQLFPKEFQSKIRVIHEGIDTQTAVPNKDVQLTLPNGVVLDKRSKVITFCARNLEPYRGFHVFMRALPEICKRHPDCHVVITGGDDVSYGVRLPEGQSYRKKLLGEVAIDPSQVHFLGSVDYEQHVRILQVSSAHVYLTVPFVLSWSIMEAMSAECVLIASDTPPVREVIKHGKNGLLVDFFNQSQLVEAVDTALNRSTKVTAMAKQARKSIVKQYDMKAALHNFETLFSEVTGQSSVKLAKAS